MDPGSALAVVGLAVQFFDVGRTAFKTISSMKTVSREMQTLKLLFKIEHQRYENWAKEAGLESETPIFFAQGHKGGYTVINIAIEIIAQICDLLTEFGSLEKRYGLQPSGSQGDPDDVALEAQKVSLANGAAVLWSVEEQTKREENLMAMQIRLSHLRRLKWAIRDKHKFQELVKQLRCLNTGLRDILPRVVQNTYDRILLIDQTDNTDTLELLASNEASRLTGQDYSSAAKIKYLKKQQEIHVAASPLSLGPAIELDLQAVGRDASNTRQGIVTMNGENVYVELRKPEDTDARMLAVIDERVKGLVSLLQISPKPANFCVLDCKGFFRAPAVASSSLSSSSSICYGIVFALPPGMERQPDVRVQTLQSLLRQARDNLVPVRYSLGERFRLATRLASSLLELHAAKWLHHNINSANVILLSREGDTGPESDNGLRRAYISGFGLARFDDPREISEIAALVGDNTYRHPDYQSVTGSSPGSGRKYCRSYDLYSLGIVLAEIGLWRQAGLLRPANANAAAFAQHMRSFVVPKLEFYMGKGYADAVMCCLDKKRLGVMDDEERILSEAFSRKVVAVLDSCRA